jgi:hypothetical protein
MLKLQARQLGALRERVSGERRRAAVAAILTRLDQAAPQLMAGYDPAAREAVVLDALEASERIGFEDPDTVLNWAYIRFLSNVRFHAHDGFRAVLEHPFLHPEAKGRHIVFAYFAIHRIQRGGTAAWSR